MKTRTAVLALSTLAIATGLAGFFLLGSGSDQGGTILNTNDARLVSMGAAIYAKHCAACLGARLEGQPEWRKRGADGLLPAPLHDASGHTWHHPDETLFRIIKFGVASVVGDPSFEAQAHRGNGRLREASRGSARWCRTDSGRWAWP